MNDPDDHDPMRVWHAQRERANMLLQLCEAVRKREVHPTVALAALGVAGVDGVLAGAAIEASLAPVLGARSGGRTHVPEAAAGILPNCDEPGPGSGVASCGAPARADFVDDPSEDTP